VWVWLRPGLSLSDLETRLDKIAVACWASTVIVDRASDGNAAYVRLDVKRRDALTATVSSPLVGLVDPDTPATERKTATVPTALDLPDVAEPAPATPGIPAGSTTRTEAATRKPAPTPAGQPAARVIAGAGGEDLSDWV
jgi:hypothetical protein